MIHPSYTELMDAINEEGNIEDEPLVTSRYSVVLATSKRARQLIAGREAMVHSSGKKTSVHSSGRDLSGQGKNPAG